MTLSVHAERRTQTPPSHRKQQPLEGVVGDSVAMRRMARLVRRCASLDVSVLIRGESGSGKELVARAVHRLSARSDGPFVAVNAGTLCDTLGGSALFGHVRGAYTGASEARQGAFRQAHAGTLFIDEVASLSPRLQAALLRVVEEDTVVAVGSDRPTSTDVRLVTATCEPLEWRVEQGLFRVDLYQRLAACVVSVPPLRERLGDLSALVAHLLREPPLRGFRVDQAAVERLRSHRFGGNVRELRNLLIQAALSIDSDVIGAADIASVLCSRGSSCAATLAPGGAQDLLIQTRGNVSAAARLAQLPRTTFRDLLRRSAS